MEKDEALALIDAHIAILTDPEAVAQWTILRGIIRWTAPASWVRSRTNYTESLSQ